MARVPGEIGVKFQLFVQQPTCASCGIKMEHQRADGAVAFWGCNNYPRCKSRLPMLTELR